MLATHNAPSTDSAPPLTLDKNLSSGTRNVMPASFVVLPEADSSNDAAYDGTDCSYEWRSLKAPTVKGVLLRLLVWLTWTPLWAPFYAFFARRSGVFKVRSRPLKYWCSASTSQQQYDLDNPAAHTQLLLWSVPWETLWADCWPSTHMCKHLSAGAERDICARAGDLQATSGSAVLQEG